MRSIDIQQSDEPMVRRYEYEDSSLVVADVGSAEGATVDVVDGTAVVVVPGNEGDRQYEIDLPSEGAKAVMRNGVVTVEIER
ncbi:DUF7127 family protein [Natronorarus salvus]|uniref:DUF7127 family protein n=1 Tax=Natronorarus salvus TaxID=3117733 RepID=UPI002F2662C0